MGYICMKTIIILLLCDCDWLKEIESEFSCSLNDFGYLWCKTNNELIYWNRHVIRIFHKIFCAVCSGNVSVITLSHFLMWIIISHYRTKMVDYNMTHVQKSTIKVDSGHTKIILRENVLLFIESLILAHLNTTQSVLWIQFPKQFPSDWVKQYNSTLYKIIIIVCCVEKIMSIDIIHHEKRILPQWFN